MALEALRPSVNSLSETRLNQTKESKCLTKCAVVAFAVGGVAGIVIVVIGGLSLFGPMGSTGFIVSIAAGSAITMISTGGLILIACFHSKQQNAAPPEDTQKKEKVTLEVKQKEPVVVQKEKGVSVEKKEDVVEEKVKVKPDSQLGKDAIAFARKKLSENPLLVATKLVAWAGDAGQPVNNEIPLLISLYMHYFDLFEKAIKKHQADPWNSLEVVDAADALMKIAYATSVLTLEDLPAFSKKCVANGSTATDVCSLTRQDAYMYRTFFYCSQVYHWLRGGLIWGPSRWRKNEEELDFPQNPLPNDFVQNFYAEGTVHHSWRALYNEYCDLVRYYVDEKELKKADSRHFKWTKKEEKPTDFYHTPDTLPT